MPLYRHSPVQSRERPSAAHINRMGRELQELSAIIRGAKGGPGIDLFLNGGGLLVALGAAFAGRIVLAKITGAPPALVPIAPSLCPYSARGLDEKIEVVGVMPVYGRQVVNDEVWVYPAKVGDLCAIARNPQNDGNRRAELVVLTEITCKGLCP